MSDDVKPSEAWQDVRTWAQERLENTERIAATKTGKDRDGWVLDGVYWKLIVTALQCFSATKLDTEASAAWQDVEAYLNKAPGVQSLKWLIQDARAADAQQLEWFQKRTAWYDQQIAALRAEKDELQEELDQQNSTTHALNLAAQVRKLEAEKAELERHAWVAGEVIQEANNHSVALRQEIARLKRWGTELLVRELMAKERAEAAEAQLTALQAEQAQWQQKEKK